MKWKTPFAICYSGKGPLQQTAPAKSPANKNQENPKVLNSTKYWFRRLASLFVLVILLASSTTNGATSSPRLAPAHTETGTGSETLSRKDRIDLFEEVWQLVNDRYYDTSFNGIDWRGVRDRYQPMLEKAGDEEQFYSLLKKMVGELHDAHTRFHTPRERKERERLQTVSTGISIGNVEGQNVIIGIDPASDASTSGIEIGMVVRTIDGKPIGERLREAQTQIGDSSSERAVKLRLYRKIIDGEPGTTFRVGLARADGSEFEVEIMRRTVSDQPRVFYKRLESGYGYIRLTLWKSPIHKEFKNAIQQLKDTPGIILDLRGNPGGEVNEVLKIAGYFLPEKTPFGRFYTRAGKLLDLYTGHDEDDIYKGSVAVLINEGSGSGSEMFSGVMQEGGRALIIGRQSCGCLLGIAKYRKVKGGGELAISELGYISPGGKKLEGAGVIPDGPVALTLSDLRHQHDRAVEEAENQLRSTIKSATNSH